jgi:hypothetical protein
MTKDNARRIKKNQSCSCSDFVFYNLWVKSTGERGKTFLAEWVLHGRNFGGVLVAGPLRELNLERGLNYQSLNRQVIL